MSPIPSTVYLIDNTNKSVFTYTAEGDGTWRFTRLSPCQRTNNAFVFFYRTSDEQERGWVLQDQTPGAHMKIIGTPRMTMSQQDTSHLPLGPWQVWGYNFLLTECMPDYPPLSDLPLNFEVPFGSMRFTEDGTVAKLEVTMTNIPITDDALEEAINQLRIILQNLARRPQMVLLILVDARDSAVPAVRHIKRYLAFIQECGVEFVLVGRGCAIILRPQGVLGSTLLAIYKMVARLMPSPWEETIVSTIEDAESFLEKFAVEYRESPLPLSYTPTDPMGEGTADVDGLHLSTSGTDLAVAASSRGDSEQNVCQPTSIQDCGIDTDGISGHDKIETKQWQTNCWCLQLAAPKVIFEET